MSTFVGMGAQVTGAGPLTPTYPAGYTAIAGDWAEIYVVGTATNNTAPSTPSGYTLVGGGRNSTEQAICYVYAKILTASEAQPSIALPTDWVTFAVQVAIRSGTDAPTSLDTALTVVETGPAATWLPASLSTTTHNGIVVSCVFTHATNAIGFQAAGGGAGFTARASGASYDTATFSFAMADRVVRSATAAHIMPTWEQTVGLNDWTGLKFAIRDAAPPAAAAPFLFAAGALFAAAAGTSITPVIPASDAANDILFMAAWCNVATTFSTPTNWNVIGTNENSANMSSAWFWKRATGSDGDPTSTTSVTGSGTNGLYGRIWVIRACITTGTPFEDPTLTALDLGTTPDTAAIDTTGPDRTAVAYVSVDDDNAWTSGNPPANWFQHGARLVSTTGGDAMSHAIEIPVPSATTVASVVIGTMANDYNKVLTLAWLPVPSAVASLTFRNVFVVPSVAAHQSHNW
jgi:hypothetical protein